ncbi:MAG: shufflon system plasmid conjugative transfer pilus tip adhesin PilV, partial [Alphaproteobacteria bacterium]|nr:shufflon system plasmid conjugative transfer pilus tip adhesin PilV [Alphaproteobacteria bacterium]
MSVLRRISGSERGGMMIEAIMMLGMMSMVTPYMFKQSNDRQQELQDVSVANQTRTILSATDSYIEQNYGAIIAGGTGPSGESFAGTDVNVTMQNLKDAGVLSTSMQDTNSFHQTYTVRLKKQASGRIDTLLVADDGGVGGIGKMRGSRIASMVGAGGGYVDVADTVSGSMGSWGSDTSVDYGGLAVTKGSIAATSSFNKNVAMSDALYRNAITGFPDANTMGTDLSMGGNNINMDSGDIVNANSITAVNITGDNAISGTASIADKAGVL